MNTAIKIIILNLIILLLACKREPIYFNIPENIRQASLYYKYNKEDTFKLLLNNSDTLAFKIDEKNIGYNIYRKRYKYYEHYQLGINGINTNINGYINVYFEHEKYNVNIIFQIDEISLVTTDLKMSYNSLEINNKTYNNVYLLTGNYDSSYTSQDKGIIKAWNDSVTFSIIE